VNTNDVGLPMLPLALTVNEPRDLGLLRSYIRSSLGRIFRLLELLVVELFRPHPGDYHTNIPTYSMS
jgi:hypothetical protein